MNSKFTNLLNELVQEWSRLEYKTINYTDTYSRKALLKFIDRVQDWTMFQHCIEDREAMTAIYKLEPMDKSKYDKFVNNTKARWTEEDLEKEYQRLPKKSIERIRKKRGS